MNDVKQPIKLIVAVLVVGLIAAAAAIGQEDPEVLSQLEEINEKLDMLTDRDDEETERAPDTGFGGAPYYTVRYFLDVDTLNDYVTDLGSYSAFSPVMYPFVNGGGGTWRVAFSRTLQVGFDFFGMGQQRLGFLDHRTDALSANDTEDENGDGLDDYYSYASYGYSMFAFLVQGKQSLAGDRLYAVFGARTGFGGETMNVSRNRRTVVTGTLDIISGSSDWTRALFLLGAYGGMQLNVDPDSNVLKIGLDVGFDYHMPMDDWMPATGVHRTVDAPPAAFNGMNVWLFLGPQFHF